MKRVERRDIADYQTYEETRAASRPVLLAEKAKRRIHVGEYLTFLFESTDTIRYQIQEMVRIEKIVREKDIQHEIDTYNDLLGQSGELGCTLLIEIDDSALRDRYLTSWLDLPSSLFITLEDGQKVRARWDVAQVGEQRLSSVQYLKFEIGELAPVAIGADHPALTVETTLTAEQRATLKQDAT